MSSKIVESTFKATLAKSFYNYAKVLPALDDVLYAGVAYVTDSEYQTYISASDSDSDAEFFGGLTPNDFDDADKTFYSQNTMSVHKVFTGGISRITERQDWVKNTIYKCWPETSSHVLSKEFVSGYARLSVYRCLFTPGTPSLNPPSGVSASEIYLPDGYVWKYLYTITNSEAQRFLSESWMPVSEKVTYNESINMSTTTNRYRQYVVQENATAGELFGFNLDSDVLAANYIDSDDVISGTYKNFPMHINARMISGELPAQRFSATVSFDSVKHSFSASLTSKGKGYVGQVEFVDSDTNAVIKGVSGALLQGKGHGSDAASEIFANNVLVTALNVPDGDTLKIIDNNNFNLITLLKNPIDAETNSVASKDFYIACKSFIVDANLFTTGDIIRPDPTDDGRRGLVTAIDGKTVYYNSYRAGKESDTFKSGEAVANLNGTKVSNIVTQNNREVIFDSAEMLMVDKKPTTLVRSEDQIETFSFILNF